MERVLLLYIPVIHQGYVNLFNKHKNSAKTLYILGQKFINELSLYHKEIRALEPELIRKSIESLDFFENVIVLNKDSLDDLEDKAIITANEAISHKFIKKYMKNPDVTYENIFLRWDEANVQSNHLPQYARTSTEKREKEFMEEAKKEAIHAAEWWRQVGGVIVKDNKIILRAHNTHLPSGLIEYSEGDPRDFVKAGTEPDKATSIHAEHLMVSEAAKDGIPLKGSHLYVTTFPCHTCAKMIACAGIKKCFFSTGNSYMDSDRILEVFKVEIIQIK